MEHLIQEAQVHGAANSDGDSGWYVTSGAGSDEGGAGGYGVVGSGNMSGYGQVSLGGTGNPSGGYQAYKEGITNYIYRNGTGGLLIIDVEIFNNNGTISADGVSSSTANRTRYNGRIDTGGASGGGSINIFFKNILKKGEITANGGIGIYGEAGSSGGNGGNGSIYIGSMLEGTYIAYVD